MRDKPLMRAMVGRLLRMAVMVVGLVFAFEILGASSLVGAVAGAAGVAGLAFGFAFQDIVENYLAGILLSVQQPFSQNDLIEVAGVTGVVVRLSMRNTLLLTLDGNHTYLPNATVFKGTVVNYTRNPKRRFTIELGVGNEEDLLEVIRVGEQTLRATTGVLNDPEPRIRTEALGDSTVLIRAYGWVEQETHDYLSVRAEAVRRLKESYDTAGFDMPEPIYRVRLHQEEPPPRKPPIKRGETTEVVVDLRPDSNLQEQVNETRSEADPDVMNG
jgi:small-conductance mechanosensitive channel